MLFTIKDVENLSGIKAHTIRIWEQRYSFLKPNRSFTNIRYYTANELKTILNVSLLCKYGFKVSEVNNMSRKAVVNEILTLSNVHAQQDVTLNNLLESMITMNAIAFENILNKYIAAQGIEDTILRLIFPFLDKVGMLWLVSNVNPTQEKLVCNIIRQKIIAGIDVLPAVASSNINVCLFLPEGEYHELSLLFVDFLLKKNGLNTLYLGHNISVKELKKIVLLKKPAYLYTHITTGGAGFNFDHFLHNMKKQFSTPITISGHHARCYEKKIPLKIQLKRSLSEVMEFVSTLKNI